MAGEEQPLDQGVLGRLAGAGANGLHGVECVLRDSDRGGHINVVVRRRAEHTLRATAKRHRQRDRGRKTDSDGNTVAPPHAKHPCTQYARSITIGNIEW